MALLFSWEGRSIDYRAVTSPRPKMHQSHSERAHLNQRSVIDCNGSRRSLPPERVHMLEYGQFLDKTLLAANLWAARAAALEAEDVRNVFPDVPDGYNPEHSGPGAVQHPIALRWHGELP